MSDRDRHGELEDILSRDDVPEDVKSAFSDKWMEVERLDNELAEQCNLAAKYRTIANNEREKCQVLEDRLSHNQKTGLPNRVVLEGYLATALHSAPGPVSILVISLDDTFDILERTQKSILSEWVLYKSAYWISEVMLDTDQLFHTRTKEFIVVSVNKSQTEIEQFTAEIRDKLSEVHRFPGYHVTVGCFIGVSISPDHGTSRGELLRNADIALAASRKTATSVAIYDPSMGEKVRETVELQNTILKTLEHQAMEDFGSQFRLVFQPFVHVELDDTGQAVCNTVGSESLLRWDHPSKGVIPPARFIPLAEENGLIVPMGHWVLYSAAETLKSWQQEGYEELYVSVNISPRQFKDDYLVETLQRVLDSKKIDPSQLKIEVTETTVMDDPESAMRKLELIHENGVKISMDDFGTGYSSLNYLRQFSIDTLKIDKSFIDDVGKDNGSRSIVRAVIGLAENMGIATLAEGVENGDQLSFIVSEGCRDIQGFLFSEPLAPEEFLTYLETDADRHLALVGA